MIEKLINYFKLNIKYALKNVFSNFKGNICMLLIIFILQAIVSVILLTYHDNSEKNTADTLENYDYHIVLLKCTKDQASYIIHPDIQYRYTFKLYPLKYEVVRVQIVEVSDELNEECYDVYIKLYGNSIIQSYNNFRQNLYEDDDPVVFSPLYYFDAKYTLSDFWYYIMEDVNYFIILITDEKPGPPEVYNCFGNPVPFFVKPFLGIDADKMKLEVGALIISLAMWATFSTIILSQTLRTKINLDKYMYGIFKMVGADVKKQRTLIRWELICMAVVTFIPAYLIGCLIYFKFLLSPILATAVVSLLLILVASRRPINIIVRESCVNLIKSSDTSDYVSSPRKSCNILKFNYPFIQAWLAIWRLRKYFLSLIFSVTILLSLFICSMSLADSYAKNLTDERPQWKLAFEEGDEFYYGYDLGIIIPQVEKINGVSKATVNADNELEIYGEGDIETSGRKIREWMYKSGYEATFTDFRTESMMHILRTTAYDKCFRIIGVMTLLMIPVICIYTQSSYYFKKRNEFKVFRTVGIETGEVKKFLRADGIFLGLFAIPFSVLTTWVCYQLILLVMGFLDTYFKLSVVNILSFAIGNIIILILLMVSPIISRRISNK